jgi:FAD/FMN-containing dehydrogenase
MLPFNRVTVDAGRRLVHAQAGARWSEIIPLLDARGLAIGVMQSDNAFSVGGSLSVNCHGWQPGRPPIASTVESFRLMQPDGSIVACSRSEHADLFSLALGGYGLFGIILDADLRVVPNVGYHIERVVLPSSEYAARFTRDVLGASDVGLSFGRLCVTKEAFLSQAILTIARETPSASLPELGEVEISSLRRSVFRGSVGSDYGKDLRWRAERDWQQLLTPAIVTRNQMMNGSIDEYVTHAADRTDIIQEYFVPPARFEAFLARLRTIFPRHPCDLLNATIRDVRADPDTAMRYATQDELALVLFLEMERTTAADQRMEALTRELIDAALAEGGCYYLPYRLHATAEQFARAYPQSTSFFAAKRALDPGELFQNEFYQRYATPMR